MVQTIIGPEQTPPDIILRKTTSKNISQIRIQVKGEHVNGSIYKRTLEISEDNKLNISELKYNPGSFDCTKTDYKIKLIAGKLIPLYLHLDPANYRMKMPSKRISLGNLVMK